jgi:hypothetical protein
VGRRGFRSGGRGHVCCFVSAKILRRGSNHSDNQGILKGWCFQGIVMISSVQDSVEISRKAREGEDKRLLRCSAGKAAATARESSS